MITELYAWVCIDKDGEEGVPSARVGSWILPLMGADLDRAQLLRKYAQDAANQTGKPVRLIRSTGIEVIDVIEPDAVTHKGVN